MTQRYFTGFSTVGAEKTRQRTYYDLPLVKRDLMNHFFTRVGERVMRADWGCAIWDYLMEPFTAGLRTKIVDEAVRVVGSDPRVTLVDINVVEFEQGIRVELTLDFSAVGIVDTMILNFERRESVRWDGGF